MINQLKSRLTNKRTGNTLDLLTDNKGQVVFDAANFRDGYNDGDTVELSFPEEFASGDASVANGRLELFGA